MPEREGLPDIIKRGIQLGLTRVSHIFHPHPMIDYPPLSLEEQRQFWQEYYDEGITQSPLEMTAADHARIHSTPPDILIENPGKSLADTMSDAQILGFLRKGKDSIAHYESPEAMNTPYAISALPAVRRQQALSLDYLERIGRLPTEFAKGDQ